jgi:ATP-dependent DNA helicase RecQ
LQAGHRAVPYHAGLTKVRRSAALDDFLRDRVDVIVATCAFGMGIDKPNVRLVVHWAPPPTPEAYYQEAGRAGRDGEFARCVLLWRDGDPALHRRQLNVTFPAPDLLERVWREPGGTTGIPANVLQSAERLRRELRPERGPIDWRPVVERRRRAAARIQAVSEYAQASGCRRARLVGYFGETLTSCSGCDRCHARPSLPKLDPAVRARMGKLRRVLGQSKTVWGGCPLEPEVLLRLARCPPANVAALADVPGVGPALVERLGAAILGALGSASAPPDGESRHRVSLALERWRAGTAREMGVPHYVVLTDAALVAIAETKPRNREELAKVRGLGPRALAKFGDALLQLTVEESVSTLHHKRQ